MQECLDWVSCYNRVLSYITVLKISPEVVCCCCSVAKLRPHVTCEATMSFTISLSLLKLMSTESMMSSNHLILCHPIFLLPSVFPRIRVFSTESAMCIRRPKYWSFSFSPFNEYSGLISFRNDWFDLLAVQGTLKSLLQHNSSKVSILQCSAFFMVQLSHPYMTTGKTITLTIWTLVSKVMSLLSNTCTAAENSECLLSDSSKWVRNLGAA